MAPNGNSIKTIRKKAVPINTGSDGSHPFNQGRRSTCAVEIVSAVGIARASGPSGAEVFYKALLDFRVPFFQLICLYGQKL